MVTNVPGDPQELYEEVYCQRGEMENRIKEQQLDLFADRTSCHRFLANQFRLLLSSAAYVLVQALRRTALAGTELARAQVGTIRLRLFKVAARVVVIGASGGVPPGEQLPVPGGVPGGLRAGDGSAAGRRRPGRVERAESVVRRWAPGRGSGGRCAPPGRRAASPARYRARIAYA